MRLQKQLNRVVAHKEYPKYLLVIPPETVEQLEWAEGQELEHEVKEHALIVRKSKTVNEEVMKIASRHARVTRK